MIHLAYLATLNALMGEHGFFWQMMRLTIVG
jgi:hypothetical protein